ncbi:MAG: hypothetical protein ACRDUW_28020, partial [Pseudonocardiaceae bacterium]
KDTKTHQMRIVSLDPGTVAILTAHQQRAEQQCAGLGTTLADDGFVFSYTPDHRQHCDLDAITHRYSRMTARLGLDTHLDGCHMDPAVGVDADRSVGVHPLGHCPVGLIQLLAVRGPQLLRVLGQAQVSAYGFADRVPRRAVQRGGVRVAPAAGSRGPTVSVLVSDPSCPPLTRWFR